MALIKCPECNHEVSEFAATCPNCGYGIAKQNEVKQPSISQIKSNSIPIFLICIFALMILISIGIFYNTSSSYSNVKFIVETASILGDNSSEISDYKQELSEMQIKRGIAIVSLVISAISMCICFLVIKNNNKNNEIIEKSQKSEESS